MDKLIRNASFSKFNATLVGNNSLGNEEKGFDEIKGIDNVTKRELSVSAKKIIPQIEKEFGDQEKFENYGRNRVKENNNKQVEKTITQERSVKKTIVKENEGRGIEDD